MSRRKQSNPKPIKRPEDEDEDGDLPAKTSQSEADMDVASDQSDATSETESQNEPMESLDTELPENDMEDSGDNVCVDTDPENVIKTEPTEEISIKTENCDSVPERDLEMSPRRVEMMSKLRFPSELLTLRKVEEAEFQHTGIPWSVSSAVHLAKGVTIGPYQGELVALSSIKPRELVLQFQGGDGDFSFIRVMEDRGAWLSLLKPAEHNSAHNTQVYFEGGKIWCKIVEELKQGTELVASFTTKAGHKSPTSAGSPVLKPAADQAGKETRPAAGKKLDGKSGSQLSPQHALIYGCPFCCVRFSSRRTLDAHLTYYCSKKPADFVSLQQLHQHLQQQAASLLEKQIESHVQATKENGLGSPRIKTEPEIGKTAKRTADEAGLESSDNSLDAEAPQHKSPKSGEVFKCLTCGYVTEKLSSFQRHRLAHSQQEDGDTITPDRLSASPVCQEEAFCKECNIQFSSISTYRGHKEFYCRSERAKHGSGGEALEGTSPTGLRQLANDLSPKLLKSPPLLLEKNGHLVAGKARIPPEMLTTNLLNTPLLLQAMTNDMQLFLQQHPSVEALSAMKLETKKTEDDNKDSDDQPLDLSKSKSDKDDSNDKDTSNGRRSVEADGKLDVKAEPRSPSQHSPGVDKVRADDDKLRGPAGSPIRPPLNIPTLHPTLLAGSQIQYVNKKPIPPLQNVSRCVECNIVFYKHENYLIHKEHYCSGRRTGKDTSESDKSDSEGKESDRVTPLSSSGLNMKTRSDLGSSISPAIEPGQVEMKTAEVLPEVAPVTKPEVCLKYYCYPCKIRFSSAGNLKAHKDFYCPHGKENSMTLLVKEPAEGDNGERHSKFESNYRCDTCKNDFLSARLLKLHICMPEVSPAPLQRCLYCDYVTQTENRLSEHMKVHIPTKAFKCNICGYRGNTARGMRMHGKTHIENGEEFTDENMIEYEEPPLVPIQRNGMCEKGPVDVETELIRMKNEPYKRRRSRKSFEKSENMVPLMGPSLLTQICAACGQTFSNINEFVIHLKMHEIAALEAMKSLRCEHCSDYIADSLTSLLVHMQTKHPEQLPGTSRHDNEATSGSEGERSKSRNSQLSNDRSRSNSVESSRMSHSSQEDRGENVSRSPESKNSNWSHGSSRNEPAQAPPGIQTMSVDKIVRVKEEVREEGEEKIAEEHRSIKQENDLVQNHKSQVIEPSPYSPQEPIRSPATPNMSSEGVAIPQAVSPKSPSSPHESRVHLSPRQQSSPTDSVKSKSPNLSQNNVPQHVKETLVSPKIESIKQESLLSPKRLSPDPKTRYLMSQNSIVVKQEQMSPPSEKPPRKATPPVSPHTPSASPKLLTGHSSPSTIHPPLSLLYNPASLLPLYQFPAGLPGLITSPDLQSSPPHSSATGEKHGRKYCKHCDINFQYLSSFLTHKKYYCSARNSTEGAQSPTATA